LLFGRRQDALETDHEQVPDQVSVNVLGPAAHVLLLKMIDPFTNGGFDFSLGFHDDLESVDAAGRPPRLANKCCAGSVRGSRVSRE
jgi:hypothetical protein